MLTTMHYTQTTKPRPTAGRRLAGRNKHVRQTQGHSQHSVQEPHLPPGFPFVGPARAEVEAEHPHVCFHACLAKASQAQWRAEEREHLEVAVMRHSSTCRVLEQSQADDNSSVDTNLGYTKQEITRSQTRKHPDRKLNRTKDGGAASRARPRTRASRTTRSPPAL